jgi:hypothetical protein
MDCDQMNRQANISNNLYLFIPMCYEYIIRIEQLTNTIWTNVICIDMMMVMRPKHVV